MSHPATVALLLLLSVACGMRPKETLTASVELAKGENLTARRRLADSVVAVLAGTLTARVKQRLQFTSDGRLDGLGLRTTTSTTHPIGGDTATSVAIECSLTTDGSISDVQQSRIVDACKAEVDDALQRQK